jgi:hypothetical protein
VTAAAVTCSIGGPIDVVSCYGADPTGVADSTTALNNAFAAATNNARYLDPGTYKISGNLKIDTRYKVIGAANRTVIQSTSAFTGTMATITGTTVTPNVIGGGLDGIVFDCNSAATVGVLYGGNATFTNYGYQTSNSFIRGCKNAGVQIGENAWELSFYNVGFFANLGDGLQQLDGVNEGENINCHSCDFSNNGKNGLTMMSSLTSGHDFHCFGCSFDNNGGWGVQNQTATSGESVVTLNGSHIEETAVAPAAAKWVQNFGRMTVNSSYLLDGRSSAAPYLIDNEGFLTWEGGRATQIGTVYFNPIQTGVTTCISVLGPWAGCTTIIDAYGQTEAFRDAQFSGYVMPNRLIQTAAKTYAGSCTMTGGTTCTFVLASGYTDYVSFASVDHASAVPSPAISAKCALSGSTVTVTAGAENSLTWDCLFIGNPY